MSTQYWDDVERVFSAVLDLPPDAARARLEALCAGRPDLRAEVDSLLAAHGRGAGTFLATRAQADQEPHDPLTTGDTIGPFRLLERIGAGGMGTVYRAERADGEFAQQVAVKLIAASVDHPSSARRFRAERQILAQLHHPHIVALLDGGITSRGQAYLVMEYVEGVPISRYCRDHALSLRDRIELVRRVCGAVQYSHQHFVVHRDLKPANILVTSDGGPKVLDFGVATLLEESPAASTTLSRVDLGAMTPNYASPEQVRGLPATAASDVYALGVLLYELLAGVRPYETAGKPLDEVMRLVVETDAPRPSTAVPRGEHRPPYDLKCLRGDLDAIVQQALRKSPEERYQSAAALSDDLQRFLSGRPVEAREPSFAYVARKLAAQHRTAFITMAVSLLVIVALLVVSVAQTRIARAERDRARAEAAKARQMAAFLGGVFRNATPARSGGKTLTARDLLDRGTESIARELNGQPDVQASLLIVMADAYSDLSDQPGVRVKALELALRSLALLDDGRAPPSIDLGNSLYAVGRKYLGVGRPAEALPFFDRALRMRELLLGPQSTAVADVLGSLALAHNALGHVDDTGPLFERAIAVYERVSPGGAAAASLLNNYGVFLLGRRQFDRAESMFRRSIADYERMPWNEQIALPLVNLGELLSRREDHDDLDAAQALFERAMSVAVPIYGAESFAVAYDLAYLGDVARRKGDLSRARTLLEQSLRLYEKTMPADNYEVVAPASYLGETLLDLHQPEQALPYLERALRISEQSKGPDHPIPDILIDIANARAQMNQLSEARAAAERALALQRGSLPADHFSFVPTLTTLGQIAARRGQRAEARSMLDEAVRIAEKTLPPTHSSRLRAEAAQAALVAAK